MLYPKYFDVHAHLQFEAFKTDREAVLEKLRESKTWVVNVGAEYETSKLARLLAEKVSEGVYATCGLHPIHTASSYHDSQEFGEEGKILSEKGEIFSAEAYRQLAQSDKVLGIGECGLDYFRLTPESKKIQKKIFIEQIHLANEIGKPLMLHIREAYDDAYEILKSEAKVPANVHFFSGDWQTAKKFLDLGHTLSFTGVITFARNYDEVIKNTPLESILSETDSPYVSPAPHRGQRNEPSYVSLVVKKIAEIKNMEEGAMGKILVKNAFRFFGINLSD